MESNGTTVAETSIKREWNVAVAETEEIEGNIETFDRTTGIQIGGYRQYFAHRFRSFARETFRLKTLLTKISLTRH